MPSKASSSLSRGKAIKTIARNAQRVIDITADRRQQSRQGLAIELLGIFEGHRRDLAELPYANKLLFICRDDGQTFVTFSLPSVPC